jgi:1,4-dihydroxy-2-naphthoyl-CoA hydrolase
VSAVAVVSTSIWFRDYTLAELSGLCRGNMLQHLGIELTALNADSLVGTMPVDERTVQPAGLLHGGASVALAESLGSIAASLCVDPERSVCVGQEISASHLRPVRKGPVTGTARPLRIGRLSQVWEILIEDSRGRKVCVVRLTVAVVDAGHGGGSRKIFED